MNEKKEIENFEQIRNLIQKEKQAATVNLRRLDFAAKLSERLAARAKLKFYTIFMKNKLVPVLGAVLILVGAGMIAKHFMILRASKENLKPAFAPIEDFFQEISRQKRILQDENKYDFGSVPGAEGFYDFVWSVKRVFYSLKREEVIDKDLPFLIYEVLHQAEENRAEPELPSENKSRDASKSAFSSGLDLPKDSYFHRLICEVLKKIEEV